MLDDLTTTGTIKYVKKEGKGKGRVEKPSFIIVCGTRFYIRCFFFRIRMNKSKNIYPFVNNYFFYLFVR